MNGFLSDRETWLSSFDKLLLDSSWNESIRQIRGLASLSRIEIDDSAPPATGIIESLLYYLTILRKQNCFMPAPSRVTSTTQREIIIEWQNDNISIEFEINEPGIGEWMISGGGLEPQFIPVSLPIPSSQQAVWERNYSPTVHYPSSSSWVISTPFEESYSNYAA